MTLVNRGHEIPAALHEAYKTASLGVSQPNWMMTRRAASYRPVIEDDHSLARAGEQVRGGQSGDG